MRMPLKVAGRRDAFARAKLHCALAQLVAEAQGQAVATGVGVRRLRLAPYAEVSALAGAQLQLNASRRKSALLDGAFRRQGTRTRASPIRSRRTGRD